MKTLMKWVAGICVVAWAVHNPAQVAADVDRIMGAGQSLISSVANAGGSALSGVTNGVTGGSAPAQAPAPVLAPVPAPAAPAPAGH